MSQISRATANAAYIIHMRRDCDKMKCVNFVYIVYKLEFQGIAIKYACGQHIKNIRGKSAGQEEKKGIAYK